MKKIKLDDNIIELNRDVESFVVQGAAGRSYLFGDKYKPLQFVHCSDMHNRPDLFSRMTEYVSYYEKYLSFVLHTGDYCGGSQLEYTDLYKSGECTRTIYNCIGNHDKEENLDWEKNMPKKATKKSVHERLFNHTEGWGVEFAPIEKPMSYYKDFSENGIRLIVLDLYYDIEEQEWWLRSVLCDAKEKNLHVITAMHEPSAKITDKPQVNFNSHSISGFDKKHERARKTPYEDAIADFILAGGIYVCNLAGHMHHDMFGYTERGVLNSVVECGTSWNGETDGDREAGTRTFDCFNVFAVDANLGVLKIVRVGNNVDILLRVKRALCYDYINKKIISDN